MDIDISTLPTPSYLVDQQLLIKNLELLSSVKERTGCKILLAQKAFSMFSADCQISGRRYLQRCYGSSFGI